MSLPQSREEGEARPLCPGSALTECMGTHGQFSRTCWAPSTDPTTLTFPGLDGHSGAPALKLHTAFPPNN